MRSYRYPSRILNLTKVSTLRLTKWLRYGAIILLMLLGCGTTLFIALNWAIFTTATPCSEDYPTAFLDKKALLQTTQSPRIVLVGDSGLAFGINSEKITDELGIETINLGVTSILTGQFTMESTKPFIQAGDIVVLSLAIPQWADAAPPSAACI